MKVYGYIYQITNLVSDKVYVGQTVCPIEKRFAQHINNALRGNKSFLYDAIRKYGAVNFSLTLLERCFSSEEMNGYEIKYIEQYGSFRRGYNMTLGGRGTPGHEASNPWNKGKKGVQVAWNKGKKMGQNFRDKCSKAKMGHKPWNKGLPKEMQPNYGKTFSNERRKNISESQRGRTLSEEQKENLRAINLGKKHSPETRRKMSEAQSGENNANYGKKFSAEYRKKLSLAHMGHATNAETRKKLSIAAKKQWQRQKGLIS